MLRVLGCITQQHDLRLVALAACICALACGTTLNLVACAQVTRKSRLLLWLGAASLVFGFGVWSLHFVAMLAFVPGIPIAYGISMTIGSALFAVLGAFAALVVWLSCPSRRIGIVAGGVLLGTSVGVMHYCGVMAMQLPGTLHFEPDEVIASIFFGICFAVVALARSAGTTSHWRRLEATAWLALAICSVHFIGMTGLSIELGQSSNRQASAVLGSDALAVTVGTASLIILIVALAATLMEQRLSQRAVLEFRRMQLLSDMSREVLIIFRDGIILLINAAGGRMFGLPGNQLVGHRVLEFIAEADHLTIAQHIHQQQITLDHEEINVRTAAGTLVPVEFSCRSIEYEGEPAITMTLRDLSARKRDEAQIRHLAHHDSLTDLPNRFLLQERLTQAMEAAGRSGHSIGLMFLDLDRFKPVNDLLGHAAGDALLIQVAARVRMQLRSADTLARVGGDEFVIVTTLDRPGSVGSVAQRIVDALSQPFDLDGRQVEIGTSIGIAFFPADGGNPEALMRSADIALYRAKREKRGTFRFFEPAMDEHLQARRQLEQDLRVAIERDELQLYYQPLVSCITGEIVGFEALLRWHHPELGVIAPLDFIPVAEETGLILKIGQWVVETACIAAVGWTEPYWVAVNISPVQFRQSDLPNIVADILRRTGLPANRLEIEMTEGVLMEDVKHAADTLSALRDLGVCLALDDFGTGYSSLSYLHAFKFDKLKIDRSFIARLGEAEDASIIVRTIIGLAHNLGLTIVAEGVETTQQLDVVREFLCDQAQGYLLGRPMQMDTPAELIPMQAERLVVNANAAEAHLISADEP